MAYYTDELKIGQPFRELREHSQITSLIDPNVLPKTMLDTEIESEKLLSYSHPPHKNVRLLLATQKMCITLIGLVGRANEPNAAKSGFVSFGGKGFGGPSTGHGAHLRN